MKVLCIFSLIVMASAAFAMDDEGNFGGGWGVEVPGGEGEISCTVLNTWSLPEGNQALGLDYIPFWYDDHIVAYADNVDNAIYYLDVDDGTSAHAGGWPTDGNNGYPFGVCQVPYSGDERIHVNDFVYDGMFSKYYATPWVEYNSLTDTKGRGLDYCPGMDVIFDFYTNTGGTYTWYVAMFTPGTSTGSTYELDPNISSTWTGSGCALYPMWNGNIGIAITMYDSGWIRFYEYPGYAGEIYYSHAIIPYSMDSSLGLTYADELGTFFHSYSVSGVYYISELQISEAALEVETWAGIKSSF